MGTGGFLYVMTRQSKRRKKRRQLAWRLKDRLLAELREKEHYYLNRKHNTSYDNNPSHWREMKARAEGHGAAEHHVASVEVTGAHPVDSLVRQVLEALAFADTVDGNWPDQYNVDIRSDIRHMGARLVDWAVKLGWTLGQTMSRVSLTVSHRNEADLHLAEVEDFDGWTAAVDELLARGTDVSVSLLPPPPHGMSVPDAYHVLVNIMARKCLEGAEVSVLLDSEPAMGPLARHVPGDGRSRATVDLGKTRLTLISGDLVGLRADAMVLPCDAQSRSRRWPVMDWDTRLPLERALLDLGEGRPLSLGDVTVTGSQGLPHVPLVLHAAVWGGDAETVSSAVRRVLDVAAERGLRSLAMQALNNGELVPEQCAWALHAGIVQHEASPDSRERPELFVTCGQDHEAFVEVFGN